MNLAQRALFIPLIFSFFFLISCSNNLWAQEEEQELPPISALYQELQEDDFLPVDRASMPTSPAFRGANDLFFFTQVNTNDNGDNILGDAANEPSMAIDPNNPDRMMMGWRQFDTVNSNFRQAGFAYSNDGGDTWTFPGVINPGVFRSDPVLSVDSDGNFHYNSLSSDTIGSFFCTQFTSTGDDTWSDGTPAKGGDKQWMTIDRSGGDGDGHIYTNWNSGLSFCPPFDFSRSVDNNLSFEDCSSIPDAPFWGTLAVGPTGELFSCGFSGNFFGELSIARSDNAQNANEPLIWNQVTSTSLGGNPVAFGGQDTPNPVGLHGQAWVDVDRSGGPSNGHVYALAAVEVFDNFPDPSDVMFIRSTDGGQTFSTPIKINDDDEAANNWQWMAAMSVAPNGRIDVVWLDTRIFPGALFSQLYYSFSMDGGLSWSPNELLVETPFDPHVGWPQQEKMGDYFHLISDEAGAHLAWAATFNNEQDVYYGRITLPVLSTQNQTSRQVGLRQNYPNPFYEATTIPYVLHRSGRVRLQIHNELGQVVRTLQDEQQTPGEYQVIWDGRINQGQLAAPGLYFYELSIDGQAALSKKMVFLR